MKKVIAFVGSARKRHTYNAVLQFLKNLQKSGDVEYEIIMLGNHQIGTCRGCRLCFDKGEEFCQLKDDRDLLIEKIMTSDGVVFASPNYSFQVSAIMKIFLDRLGFVFHRPRFFGKTFTSIVIQGIYGGQKVVKYLDFVGYALGFNTVKGSCIHSLEPMTEKQEQKTHKIIAGHSERFYKRLMKSSYPIPALLDLFIFRMARTSIKLMLEGNRDYMYYEEAGWFKSDFYYPVHLGVLKKVAGNLFDSIGAMTVRHR
jgi:multimeric flavodoxin WrbA